MVDKTVVNVDDEDFANRDFLQGKDLSKQTSYGRPPVPDNLCDRNDDITFMQIDCDYYSRRDGKPKICN